MFKADSIYSRGLAISSYDLLTNTWYFRFWDEDFALTSLNLDSCRPSRCLIMFSIPELKYGYVAKIEDVLQAVDHQERLTSH